MQMDPENIILDRKIAGLYDLGGTLGRGHFAVVKQGKHVFTGEQVAVKVIDKTKLDDVSRAHLFQEVRCMKLVQHPNVVRLYEVIDTHTKLYLILELGDGGDMYDYIMKHEKGVDEETAKKYFKQIVNAISYCHKLHVVHRDLKPENVVFFEKMGMVKLTDFGFSNKFCPGQNLETSCGSLAYSAPEILLGDSYDAPKVDVWSLGVILYMLVCGRAPFQEANDSETLTMIMDCKYSVPDYVSPQCRLLIKQMLIRDPEKRASLDSIAMDPWLSLGEPPHLVSACMPLISRDHLSEEDHAFILQKMVSGNIASKEEIIESLEKRKYDHITATYFLLAERRLRALKQEKAQLAKNLSLPAVVITAGCGVGGSPARQKNKAVTRTTSWNCTSSAGLSALPVRPPEAPLALELPSSPTLPLGRKCSIVREEEDSGTTLLEQLSIITEDPLLPGDGCRVPQPVTATKSLPPSDSTATQEPLGPSQFLAPAKGLHSVSSSPHLLVSSLPQQYISSNDLCGEVDSRSDSILDAADHSPSKRLSTLGERCNENCNGSCANSDSSRGSDKNGKNVQDIVSKLEETDSRHKDGRVVLGSVGDGSGREQRLELDNSRGSPCRGHRHLFVGDSKTANDRIDQCPKYANITDIVFCNDLSAEVQHRHITSVSCGDLAADSLLMKKENSLLEPFRAHLGSLSSQSKTHCVSSVAATENTERSVPSPTGPCLPTALGSSSPKRNSNVCISESNSCGPSNGPVTEKLREPTSDLSKSSPKSSGERCLDINQNRWRKEQEQTATVVDGKLSSKCCTLC